MEIPEDDLDFKEKRYWSIPRPNPKPKAVPNQKVQLGRESIIGNGADTKITNYIYVRSLFHWSHSWTKSLTLDMYASDYM